MKNSNLIQKIAETPVKQDKNGKNYKTITFATIGKDIVEHPALGKIVVDSPVKQSSINVYEESYLNGKQDFGYNLALKSFVMGDIITRKVPEYTIEDKTTLQERVVSSYTTVVFGDTDSESFELEVKKAFQSKGHNLDYLTVQAEIKAETLNPVAVETASELDLDYKFN